jgi:hypothetical protein
MNTRLLKTLLASCLVVALTACQHPAQSDSSAAPPSIGQRGRALFDEKCKTVAGEKIYRMVENVEGIVLLKVRPRAGEKQWQDPMWPGAAFALEATADEYITTFLGREYGGSTLDGKPTPITKAYRGYISTKSESGGLPGYRYVDVIDDKDGKRYRYVGVRKVVGKQDAKAYNIQVELKRNPNYDLNIYAYVLDKTPAPAPAPRYGVTYEDHVIPEERALGLASSTVKVIDLQAKEVLGEMTRYAWGSLKVTSANPSPWLSAYKCPGHTRGAEAATRKFVDQILIPAKEK